MTSPAPSGPVGPVRSFTGAGSADLCPGRRPSGGHRIVSFTDGRDSKPIPASADAPAGGPGSSRIAVFMTASVPRSKEAPGGSSDYGQAGLDPNESRRTSVSSGGSKYKPSTSINFSSNLGSFESLNVFTKCGRKPRADHPRCIVADETNWPSPAHRLPGAPDPRHLLTHRNPPQAWLVDSLRDLVRSAETANRERCFERLGGDLG